MLDQSQSHYPLGAWDQAPVRRLGGFGHCWLDQHGGGLQRIVAAPPRLPEDALLTLLPLPGNGVEVLSIKVGVATGTEPPATCRGKKKMEHGQAESLGLYWGWDRDEARHWILYALDGKDLTVFVFRLCSEEPQVVTEEPQGL